MLSHRPVWGLARASRRSGVARGWIGAADRGGRPSPRPDLGLKPTGRHEHPPQRRDPDNNVSS